MTDSAATGNKPVFQAVFGDQWEDLPVVMKKHYAPRAGSRDMVRVSGHLDVKVAWFMRVAARLTGMLVPYSGNKVPVTVTFTSPDNHSFHLDRVFRFAGRKPLRFRSRMEHIGGNELIEFMRFGIGWKLACHWDGAKVILDHRGYVWRLFGVTIPVPLAWVIGKGYAEEVPLSDECFSMWTHSHHPLFGQVFGYAGSFRIEEVTCAPS